MNWSTLEIIDIGPYENSVLPLDKPLVILSGEEGSGKTAAVAAFCYAVTGSMPNAYPGWRDGASGGGACLSAGKEMKFGHRFKGSRSVYLGSKFYGLADGLTLAVEKFGLKISPDHYGKLAPMVVSPGAFCRATDAQRMALTELLDGGEKLSVGRLLVDHKLMDEKSVTWLINAGILSPDPSDDLVGDIRRAHKKAYEARADQARDKKNFGSELEALKKNGSAVAPADLDSMRSSVRQKRTALDLLIRALGTIDQKIKGADLEGTEFKLSVAKGNLDALLATRPEPVVEEIFTEAESAINELGKQMSGLSAIELPATATCPFINVSCPDLEQAIKENQEGIAKAKELKESLKDWQGRLEVLEAQDKAYKGYGESVASAKATVQELQDHIAKVQADAREAQGTKVTVEADIAAKRAELDSMADEIAKAEQGAAFGEQVTRLEKSLAESEKKWNAYNILTGLLDEDGDLMGIVNAGRGSGSKFQDAWVGFLRELCGEKAQADIVNWTVAFSGRRARRIDALSTGETLKVNLAAQLAAAKLTGIHCIALDDLESIGPTAQAKLMGLLVKVAKSAPDFRILLSVEAKSTGMFLAGGVSEFMSGVAVSNNNTFEPIPYDEQKEWSDGSLVSLK